MLMETARNTLSSPAVVTAAAAPAQVLAVPSALPRLTERQARVLQYIYESITRYRAVPTRQELAAALKMPQGSIGKHLAGLEAKGLLAKRQKRAARNVELTLLAADYAQFHFTRNANPFSENTLT